MLGALTSNDQHASTLLSTNLSISFTQSFFILALIVCDLGSGWSPLPMTLSLVPSQEDLKMAEASGGRVSLPAPAQLDNQYIQGVSAVIFSDHRLAHHHTGLYM